MANLILQFCFLLMFGTTLIFGQMVVDSMGGTATEEAAYDDYGPSCLDDERACADGINCVLISEWCDGTPQCDDQSDENNCTANATETNSTTSAPTTTTEPDYYTSGCDPGLFECSSGICLQQTSVCDGTMDCDDGSDEVGCPTSAATTTTEADYYTYGCNPGQFDCNNGVCLEQTSMCNGILDCDDGSDEVGCPSTTTTATTAEPTTTTFTEYDYGDCPEGDFQCEDFVCIPVSSRCDGEFDCSNNEDEDNCPDMGNMTQSTTATTTPGITCSYEGNIYAANEIIISTNCTEVTCSSTGRITTWNSYDPTCGATATAATSPEPPANARNFTAWALTFIDWRYSLFERWLPGMKKYIRITGVSADSLAPPNCPPVEAVSCYPKSCVLDPVGCQYCYCNLLVTDSRDTLIAAFDRDYEFWKNRVDPIWTKVFQKYEQTLN